MNGSYKGDNAALAEKTRIWLDSLISRARIAMPELVPFTMTRSAQKFMTLLEYAQVLPDIVVIAADAGVGKTITCQKYKDTHPNVWMLTAEPSISSPSRILEYLREVIGLPNLPTQKIPHAVTRKLTGTQGLVIIDEAQRLSTMALDQLRSIYDNAGIGLALVGNREVWNRIDGGGQKARLAQLFSRVGMALTVTKLPAADINMVIGAAGVTDMEQRQLLRVIAEKPGALRGMTKTLRGARMVANGAGAALTTAHISAAWARRSGRQDGVE
jgi:DNA transposition AAA+ family ATPase